jgi:hypothetical protein
MKNASKANGGKSDGDAELKRLMDALRAAHENVLEWAWKKHGAALFVSSMMHLLHSAMMDHEVEFLNRHVSQDGEEKPTNAKKAKPNGRK